MFRANPAGLFEGYTGLTQWQAVVTGLCWHHPGSEESNSGLPKCNGMRQDLHLHGMGASPASQEKDSNLLGSLMRFCGVFRLSLSPPVTMVARAGSYTLTLLQRLLWAGITFFMYDVSRIKGNLLLIIQPLSPLMPKCKRAYFLIRHYTNPRLMSIVFFNIIYLTLSCDVY